MPNGQRRNIGPGDPFGRAPGGGQGAGGQPLAGAGESGDARSETGGTPFGPADPFGTKGGVPIVPEESGAPGGTPIGSAVPAGPSGGTPIGPGDAAPAGGLPIRSEAGPAAPGRPIEGEPEFGLPGASIEAPGAFFAGAPVLGPASIFNIGGAPIAILGGVFGGGLPIGGPVTQIFRSGAPIPNTLYIVTLESSGPIGQFFLPTGGGPIGPMGRPGADGLPISMSFGEAGTPIFGTGGLSRPVAGPIGEGGMMP